MVQISQKNAKKIAKKMQIFYKTLSYLYLHFYKKMEEWQDRPDGQTPMEYIQKYIITPCIVYSY